jgi:hypothetical protein
MKLPSWSLDALVSDQRFVLGKLALNDELEVI